MTHVQNEMITEPDHHVGGMGEDVQPCEQVPYHFLTTVGEISTIRCVGLPLASEARKNLVVQNL